MDQERDKQDLIRAIRVHPDALELARELLQSARLTVVQPPHLHLTNLGDGSLEVDIHGQSPEVLKPTQGLSVLPRALEPCATDDTDAPIGEVYLSHGALLTMKATSGTTVHIDASRLQRSRAGTLHFLVGRRTKLASDLFGLPAGRAVEIELPQDAELLIAGMGYSIKHAGLPQAPK